MDKYKKSMDVMNILFGKDFQFALATSVDNVPSVRYVDTFYSEGAFYIVTYKTSQKVREIEKNKNISMCHKLIRFRGEAYDIGHPLEEKNALIREKLIKVFDSWYFKHNDESDPNMCYIKIELKNGFFYKDGKGYQVDFIRKTAEEIPFMFDIVMID